MDDPALLPALTRIAEALERLAPPPAGVLDLTVADAFVWHPEPRARLAPVPKVAAVPIGLLRGVDRQKELLVENTLRFARGFTANNAMLWGARGTGASLPRGCRATAPAPTACRVLSPDWAMAATLAPSTRHANPRRPARPSHAGHLLRSGGKKGLGRRRVRLMARSGAPTTNVVQGSAGIVF